MEYFKFLVESVPSPTSGILLEPCVFTDPPYHNPTVSNQRMKKNRVPYFQSWSSSWMFSVVVRACWVGILLIWTSSCVLIKSIGGSTFTLRSGICETWNFLFWTSHQRIWIPGINNSPVLEGISAWLVFPKALTPWGVSFVSKTGGSA